jgi:hypothetical protein
MSRNSTVEEVLPRELAEARFSRLYGDHEREILRYALRRSEDAEDAADVVLGIPTVAARMRLHRAWDPLLPSKQRLQRERGAPPPPR